MAIPPPAASCVCRRVKETQHSWRNEQNKKQNNNNNKTITRKQTMGNKFFNREKRQAETESSKKQMHRYLAGKYEIFLVTKLKFIDMGREGPDACWLQTTIAITPRLLTFKYKTIKNNVLTMYVKYSSVEHKAQ